MSPPLCLCKVGCGAQQGPSPFLLLAVAATLLAFLVAIAASKQSSVLEGPVRRRRRQSTSLSSSDSRSDNDDGDSGNSDTNSDSDGSGDSDSPEILRADVENRLAAFQREQEASLQEFRANTTAETTRQRRILSDRSAAESGRLTAAIDNLRRRFVDHQVSLRETNRAIQELRSRGPNTPRGSPPHRFARTPSPPGTRERSRTPTAQRVVFHHPPGAARPSRDNQATANVAPIFPTGREGRQRRPE